MVISYVFIHCTETKQGDADDAAALKRIAYQNDPNDWDGIEEWDDPAHELDYNLVWHDGDEAGEYYPIPKVA